MTDYECDCGARFHIESHYHDHLRVAPKRCLKANRGMFTPAQYAEAPTEHAQQVALFMWAALPETQKQYPVLQYMFAIPNGGQRDGITASRLKAEGVKSGALDIFLPVPKRIAHTGNGPVSWTNCCGLFIEMKRPKTQDQRAGQLSNMQSTFATYLAQVGYAVAVCYSFDEARQVIIGYLTGNINLRPAS